MDGSPVPGTCHVEKLSSSRTIYFLKLCLKSIFSGQSGQPLLAWDWEILSELSLTWCFTNKNRFAILSDILDVWKCLSCHAGVFGYAHVEARDAANQYTLSKAVPLPPSKEYLIPNCKNTEIEEQYVKIIFCSLRNSDFHPEKQLKQPTAVKAYLIFYWV